MSDNRDDDLMRGRHTAAPSADTGVEQLVRTRQRSRAKVMAVLLGLFVVLVFAISIVKMTPGIVQ